MNPKLEENLKLLEQKIEQVTEVVDRLKQENNELKLKLTNLKKINSEIISKIDFMLDSINKLL
ncbi:MAG: hypothetical protein ABIK19_00690 [candidate division WOR-3 bacterium]